MGKTIAAASCLLLCPAARALDLDGRWQLLTGGDELEQTAAGMFRDEAARRFGARLDAPRPESAADPARPALVIGTVADSSLIAAAHARAPFRLAPDSPESFHARLDGNRLYAVGATPKGAMNAAFRILDRNRANVDRLDFAGRPNFRWRAGGNECNQTPPPGWSHDDQARYYARHYINVVWGEKKRPPLPHDVRRKYGIGVMAEVRFPQNASREWLDDPANREAIFSIVPAQKRPNLWHDAEGLRVISPFAPAGRRWYLDQYKKLYKENPDLKILYDMFSDYNALPETTDSVNAFTGEPYAHSIEDTIVEILKIMREAVGQDSGIVPRAWLWQAFWFQRGRELRFMDRLAEEGFGLMYNEAGNNDNWVFSLDNFDDAAMKTRGGRIVHGGEYLSLVSAGGACESVNPVIGMPLPRIAAHKLALLARAGVRDFVLWWASCEGWTYQPNLEVIAELTWADEDEIARYASKDFNAVAPLLERLAARDFGPELAPGMVEYYKNFDAALVTGLPLYKKPNREAQGDPAENGLHIYNWYQRLGTYTEILFQGAFLEPVTAEALINTKRFENSCAWGANDYTLANYEAALARLRAAQAGLASLLASAKAGTPKDRMQQLYNWTQLAVLLWEAQYHHLKGLALINTLGGGKADPAAARRAIAPLTRESIRNTRAILALLPAFAPNMNLTEGHAGVIENRGSVLNETRSLRDKLTGMELELAGRFDLAKGRRADASSVGDPKKRGVHNAVDGDALTLWSPRGDAPAWLQIDLGATRPLELARLGWGPAFAVEYTIELSDDAKSWRPAIRMTDGTEGNITLPLPPGSAARYVRLNCLRHAPHQRGYALREIKVY
ncbi:MAG: discoidin domain-containing protein [Opitutaceae bacterium]|nr:discoidin domain-containing protein [Opitutaceae bacterium]